MNEMANIDDSNVVAHPKAEPINQYYRKNAEGERGSEQRCSGENEISPEPSSIFP
jgi:hypothetical protein